MLWSRVAAICILYIGCGELVVGGVCAGLETNERLNEFWRGRGSAAIGRDEVLHSLCIVGLLACEFLRSRSSAKRLPWDLILISSDVVSANSITSKKLANLHKRVYVVVNQLEIERLTWLVFSFPYKTNCAYIYCTLNKCYYFFVINSWCNVRIRLN